MNTCLISSKLHQFCTYFFIATPRHDICIPFNEGNCAQHNCYKHHVCLHCLGDHRIKSYIHEEISLNLYCTSYNVSACRDACCRLRHRCIICHKTHSAQLSTSCKKTLEMTPLRSNICETFNEDTCTKSKCLNQHICIYCRWPSHFAALRAHSTHATLFGTTPLNSD